MRDLRLSPEYLAWCESRGLWREIKLVEAMRKRIVQEGR